jgi:HPt (histidine-containing phosphotransfer) domain-containing protein
MASMIDTERVVELERLMKEPLGDIVAELTQSMDESIERARTALAAADLDTAARAAHRFRNDALIVGAGPLERALAELENHARAGEQAASEIDLQDVAHIWSRTRPELLEAAASR